MWPTSLCVRIKRFDTHRHTSTHGSLVVQLIASSLYRLHCPGSRNFQSHWRVEWSWNRDGKWLIDRSINQSIRLCGHSSRHLHWDLGMFLIHSRLKLWAGLRAYVPPRPHAPLWSAAENVMTPCYSIYRAQHIKVRPTRRNKGLQGVAL